MAHIDVLAELSTLIGSWTFLGGGTRAQQHHRCLYTVFCFFSFFLKEVRLGLVSF